MPQRLKEDVRDRIVAAAAIAFAESGYLNATLTDIAHRANVTTSNIYKYYDNKQALFDVVVTSSDAARLFRLLRARLNEFASLGSWSGADADGSTHAKALLAFWVERRLAVLILLKGADGTRYAKLHVRMAREMARQAEQFVRKRRGREPEPHFKMVLRQIFSNTVAMIAAILEQYESERDIAKAFTTFWTYQLAGLEALIKNAGGTREGIFTRDPSRGAV